MFEIIVPAVWTCLAVYGAWYLTSAKHYAPLTPQEAQILWKIHKQQSGCKGKRMWRIQHKGVLVGFQLIRLHVRIQRMKLRKTGKVGSTPH